MTSSKWKGGIISDPLGTTELVKTGKLDLEDDSYGRRICILKSVIPPTASDNPGEVIHEVYLKVGKIFINPKNEQGGYVRKFPDGQQKTVDYILNGNLNLPIDTSVKTVYGYKNVGDSTQLSLYDKDEEPNR
tara:strand:+ start:1112 stop:1507 length:396 start_codon:yes stop_codon:yes gene_type:complete